jgi:hypothetical protein
MGKGVWQLHESAGCTRRATERKTDVETPDSCFSSSLAELLGDTVDYFRYTATQLQIQAASTGMEHC